MRKSSGQTQIQRAISLLRRFGTDAHLWLPGGDTKTYGPELVVNGDFSNGTTGWQQGTNTTSSAAVVNGEMVVTSTSASPYGSQATAVTCVIGRRYSTTATYRANNATNCFIGFSTSLTSVNTTYPYQSTMHANATNITYTGSFVATSTTHYIHAAVTGNGNSGTFDNISVREITSQTSAILNGLTTGNYLESTGNTLLTVDNPCGLVLDALGTVGSELVPATALTSTIGWLGSNATVAVVGSELEITSLGSGFAFADISIGATSKLMKLLAACRMGASGGTSVTVGVANAIGTSYIPANTLQSTVTGYAVYDKPNGATSIRVLLNATGAGQKGYFSLISVREVSGIHLTQATTANKGVLRLTSGRYNWVFDATDLLTGTFPAGYESVTVIDAKSTGQVTTAAANIVGSYSIGPSYTSYGRIVVKGSLTASELTLLQGFANKLAGL